MGSEWKTKDLKDCATWYSGGTPRKGTAEYWGGDIPWISAKSLKDFFVSDSEDKVTEEGSRNGTKLVPKDTILFVVRGMSLKSEFRIGITTRPVTFNQDLKALVANDEILPHFLAYAIRGRTAEILDLVGEAGHGTGVLPTDRIQAVQIPCLPLKEQQRIIDVLRTLDDKIELNRRMNATLEGMAQALFKSWFVDFDPVIDNALAAGNPIPDELAPRAEVRKKALSMGTSQQGSVDHPTLSDPKSLFPAAFEFTEEMGWIPEGWETQPLYDIADFVNGAAYKGADFSDAEDALPVIKIAEVKAGITGQTKFTTINKGDKYRVVDGDILLSWSGNPDTSIDTFIWTDGPGYLNQHIFNVRLHDESERHFVYYQLKFLRSTFAEIARDKQTTGLGHFTAGDMKRLMVFRPTTSVLEQFNAAVSSIYSRAYENRIATKTLTKLRNTLLPKLISGGLQPTTSHDS
ncbi:restriction endonuclease subunit S [Haloferula chungangensis]|uniref:Restriction endonuclease subunit S n=1 Tax=Haloferula chungangensis TaxID=1048331 RepID=A0ABW2L236_9BACT